MAVHALNAPFHGRPQRFNVLRVAYAINILLFAVGDSSVAVTPNG